MTDSRHEAVPDDECPLLDKLPAELRNHIYRLALVDDRLVVISSTGFVEPGLLVACRQIRREARTIFYAENTFLLDVGDYDHTVTKFWTYKGLLADEDSRIPHGGVILFGSLRPNWEGLMEWLKAYHSCSTVFGVSNPPETCLSDAAILDQTLAAITHAVRLLRPREWAEVEAMLLRYRPILNAMEDGWDE